MQTRQPPRFPSRRQARAGLRSPVASPRPCQRGLSLVDMMIGITIGLFAVAAAIVLVVSQLGENRRLVLETQVQQDLRAAADLVTRDLRRAGYDLDALNGLWLPDRPRLLPTESASALRDADLGDPGAPDYRYTRAGDRFFRLSWTAAEGTIYRQIGASGRQALTDRSTLKVTLFGVRAAPGPVTVSTLACPDLCPDGTQDCWPTLRVNDLLVEIEGEAVGDSQLRRRIESRVRLRNDAIDFRASGGQVCP